MACTAYVRVSSINPEVIMLAWRIVFWWSEFSDKLWMAPELLRIGRIPSVVSPSADIYSMGIIISEILSRDRPYGAYEDITYEGVLVPYLEIFPGCKFLVFLSQKSSKRFAKESSPYFGPFYGTNTMPIWMRVWSNSWRIVGSRNRIDVRKSTKSVSPWRKWGRESERLSHCTLKH